MVLKSCFLLPLFVEKVSHNRIYLLIKFHVYRKRFIKFHEITWYFNLCCREYVSCHSKLNFLGLALTEYCEYSMFTNDQSPDFIGTMTVSTVWSQLFPHTSTQSRFTGKHLSYFSYSGQRRSRREADYGGPEKICQPVCLCPEVPVHIVSLDTSHVEAQRRYHKGRLNLS